MWHDGSQNNEVSCSFRLCSRNLAEDQDPTELLDKYPLTRAGENDSNSWSIAFNNLHLFILHRPSSSIVCQFSHQFKKARKMYTPSTHNLVVGFWVGPKGREAALPSFV